MKDDDMTNRVDSIMMLTYVFESTLTLAALRALYRNPKNSGKVSTSNRLIFLTVRLAIKPTELPW